MRSTTVTTRVRRSMRRPAGDQGAAMISVIFLLVALTAIGATVATVTVNDLISSGRDRQGTAALATADAGVSQALEFIRLNGVGQLRCNEANAFPPTLACAATPATPSARWGSPVNPQQVRLDGTVGNCDPGLGCYRVWISTVKPYNPPTVKAGTYRIHSTGFFGGGPGAKSVAVDVKATPAEFPVGVFGEGLDGNGATEVRSEILFTRDCVSPRHTGSGNGIRFTDNSGNITIDPYWDQPAAANSTNVVSAANNCGTSGNIHRPAVGVCATGTGGVLRNDRDSLGGPVTSGQCYRTYQRQDGTWYPDGDTTRFTLDDLQRYGYQPGGLSGDEYEALRVQSQGMGLYNPTSGQILTRLNAAVAAGVTHPVIYVDSGNDLSFSRTDIPAIFNRAPTVVTIPASTVPSTCTAPYSVVVVVRNADIVYQGGNSEWRSMAVFVPEGDFTGNGGYNIVGTLFANNISLGGNERWQLDDCFVDNMPGPLLQLTVETFREDDRSDVG